MKLFIAISLILGMSLLPLNSAPAGAAASGGRLVARVYNSGFPEGHDTYNGMGAASDGRIYYVLSSESYDVAAQMFSFDPKTGKIQRLGDLTEACGEQGTKCIPQGKSHVNFVELDGKLYFATHIGVYAIVDGRETMGLPPPGYQPYRGGHFLSYDLHSGTFEDLGLNPNHDGIISMTADPKRRRLYGLSWPSGHFLRYDVPRKELRDLGPIPGQLPNVPVYRALCRSLVVSAEDGSTYFTTVDGQILRYRYDRDTVEIIPGEDMKKDYFGLFDPNKPGHMGYNWRQAFWYPPEKRIYGVHGNSGYLFSFDPAVPRVEVVDRLTSEPSQRCGMFDQFSFGYLGFALGPDLQTIYYLTGGPVYLHGKRVAGKAATAKGEARGLEDLHLITWNIPQGRYTDHGAVFYENGERPLYVNSLAVGLDGSVYSLGRVTEKGKTRADLFRVSAAQIKPVN